MMMMRMARRAPLAVAAATTSRSSVWWRPLALPVRRSLTTPSAPTNDSAAAVQAPEFESNKEHHFALLPAFLETYTASMGHHVVPYYFQIPPQGVTASSESLATRAHLFGRARDMTAIPWAAELRGKNMGRVLNRFATSTKHQEDYPEVTAALWRMGFPLGAAYRRLKWDKQIMAALQAFHRIHGHTDVPADFQVPHGDAVWPVATWQVALGAWTQDIRRGANKLDADKLADLKRVKFPLEEAKKIPTSADHAKQSLLKDTQQVSKASGKVSKAIEKPPKNPWDFTLRADFQQSADHEASGSAPKNADTEYRWSKRILPSLKVFSQEFGHCHVPLRFAVPSESPWPTEAWTLKLGMCVENIRVRGDYAMQAKRDAAELTGLGFVWDEKKQTTPAATEDSPLGVTATKTEDAEAKNAAAFALLPAFLETFRVSAGHFVVPYRFVVPDTDDDVSTPSESSGLLYGLVRDPVEISWADDMRGMNMGRILRRFATSAIHQQNYPEVTKALHQMRLPLGNGYHKLKWEHQIMAALKTFHGLHGHTNVPADFCVPRGDDAWPVATWGYELGVLVETLRQGADTLDAAKLADLASLQLPHGEGKPTWADRAKQLQRAGAGNAVPVQQKPQGVHKDPLSLKESWDFEVCNDHSHSPDRETQPGRSVEHDSENQWSEFILPSLEVFYQVKDHCFVGKHFIVPSESLWPTKAWGLKLGTYAERMRANGDYSTQIKRDAARLNAINFAWDVSEYKWRELIFPALKVFAEQFGHCDVPRVFVVPSDPSWPRQTWGFTLGASINEVRAHEYYFRQAERDAAQLEAIGFVRPPSEYRWSHVVLPALETFSSKFRHCDVPTKFVVPSSSPWPKEAWGLKLGYCVRSIWSSSAFAAQVERDADRLHAIDFAERSADYKWTNMVLPALQVFAEQYHHCQVPRLFVVPSKSPWPAKAWGWRLGAVVRTIRASNDYTEQAKRDAAQLEAIGFKW